MREILALIYIRTLLDLAEYRQTPTMLKMFKRCTELEKRIYNKDKKLYNQCQSIAKEVWTKIKDDHREYVIEVEPVIYNLYIKCEDEFKKLKLKPTLFNRLFDKYANVSDCKLEVKSMKLSDYIWTITNEVMLKSIKY